MKKFLLVVITCCFISYASKAQITYTLNYTQPSCSTCCDGSVSLDSLWGGCGFYSYQWQGSVFGVSYPGLCFGDSVAYTITDGCGQSVSGTARMTAPVGISDLTKSLTSVSVYPNPTFGKVVIHNNTEKFEAIEVYNSLGERIKLIEVVNQEQIEVDLSAYSRGIYFINCISENKSFEVKIVIQ